MGGTKAVPIADDGVVVFDNLCMTEASTKHAEKEFTLEFYFIHTDGRESSSSRRTTSFYAYSHKKVLTRRSMDPFSYLSPFNIPAANFRFAFSSSQKIYPFEL